MTLITKSPDLTESRPLFSGDAVTSLVMPPLVSGDAATGCHSQKIFFLTHETSKNEIEIIRSRSNRALLMLRKWFAQFLVRLRRSFLLVRGRISDAFLEGNTQSLWQRLRHFALEEEPEKLEKKW